MLETLASWLGLDGTCCCSSEKTGDIDVTIDSSQRKGDVSLLEEPVSIFPESSNQVSPKDNVSLEASGTPTTAASSAATGGSSKSGKGQTAEEAVDFKLDAERPDSPAQKQSEYDDDGRDRTLSGKLSEESAQEIERVNTDAIQFPELPEKAPVPEDQVVLDGLRSRMAKSRLVLDQLVQQVETQIIKGSIPATDEEHRERQFLTKSTLMRYLCMQDGNTDKAVKAIKDTLTWRKKMFKRELFVDGSPVPMCRACLKDPTAHCFLTLGKDVLGRYVIYSCAGRARNKTPEDGIEHMAAEIERIFQNSSLPGSIVWIVDFAGFGFSDCNPKTGVLAFPMFASHYPERFGQIVCLGLPYAFYPLYAAAGKIFDTATMQKVVTLKGDKEWNRYADAYWSNDPAMKAWLNAAVKCKGSPGCFPDMALTRALQRVPETELAIRTLDRCAGCNA